MVLGIVFILLLLYIALLTFYIFAFSLPAKDGEMTLESFSIVIAVKNEKQRLPALLANLEQLWAGQDIKIIVVNDHSTDAVPKEQYGSMKVEFINLPEGESGKKSALRRGVQAAVHEWVLFLDADVEIDQLFFQSLHGDAGSQMIIFPIRPIKRKGIINAFFDLDFLGLQFAGLASARLGLPLLANGACMMVRREAYLQSLPLRNDWTIESGDDIFAMQAISRLYGRKSIGVRLNTKVDADFPTSLTGLFSQRLRWSSKTVSSRDWYYLCVAGLTFMANFSFLILITYIFFNPVEWQVYAVLGIFITIQSTALYRVSLHLNRKDLRGFILPSIFVYPIYLIALVLTGLIFKPRWK